MQIHVIINFEKYLYNLMGGDYYDRPVIQTTGSNHNFSVQAE